MAALAFARFAAQHLLVLLVLTATAWVAGRLVLRRLEMGSLWERFAVSGALGLTLLGHAFFALGLCGWLTRGAVAAVVVGVHLLGSGVWREALRGLRWPGWRGWGIAAAAVAGLAPLFVLSLYPPTAFDETLYHLPFARAFATTGGMPFLPDVRVPVFPQLLEVLHAAVLLHAGDVATHQVQLLATILTAVLLAAWGLQASRAEGWLAAGLYLGGPIVVHLAATGYVEAGLVLFATAAVYAAERWRRAGGGPEARGWLLLAGGFAGSAGAVKYLGLYFVGIIGLAVFAWAAPKRRLRPALGVALAAGAVLAPWYGRIFYYTGNPLFPFFPSLFPGMLDAWTFGGTLPTRPPGDRFVDFLRLPWDVVFHRESVGWQPPFSPAFLLGVPLLLVAVLRLARVRWLLAAVVAYAAIFLLLPPDARYLVAVLPLLSLALAAAVARWAPPRLALALALALLLPGWLYGGYRIWAQGPVPVSVAARERYLERQLPAYPAVRFLNRSHGHRSTVYALRAENLFYYAEGRFLGDWNGPARFGLVMPLLGQPEALWRELRRLGADHLLVVYGVVAPPVDDPAFRRRFRRVYFDAAAEVWELTGSPPAPTPPRPIPPPGR